MSELKWCEALPYLLTVKRKSCLEERASSLSAQSADPNGGIYIPQCTSDDKYSIVQCHKYCWCADPETGLPLKGIKAILKSNGYPNCNITAERPMPGKDDMFSPGTCD